MDSTEAECRGNTTAYLHAMADKGLCADKGSLLFQMRSLYGDIDFRDKTILDIGGGSGIHSFYAACCGAKKVLCLEPECSGSSKGVIDQFRELSEVLGYENVEIEPISLQELECGSKRFEIVMLHNSINHLDEEACINLLRDSRAKSVYQEIFAKIFGLCTEGARIIICDCSRHNVSALFGVRNPLAPGIEWHKHQTPETWANMLGDAGFVNPGIRWSSPNRFRRWGRALFGNRCMAYFFSSHFCLTMDRDPS